MATLGELKAQIADDLARSDLGSQISGAISDAIKHYEVERFWFNDSRSLTFATVPFQSNYGAAANPLIPRLVRIDALYLTYGINSIYDLERIYPENFELEAAYAPQGRPTIFCYAPNPTDGSMELLLSPIPNDVFQMRVNGVYKLVPLTDDNASNAWTTEAAELIRAAAKARIHLHVTHEPEETTIMQMAINGPDGFLARLRQETSARTSLGRIVPTDF